ncbi:hypothetical protein IFM89_034680 [Coptis chinensis]|uniref:Uncharacterized protein n=1 Tax=Coptis chinensis TaxID=261450 RepID=A0A835HPE0_9MAGN|nr:hypothetical protein IFM89_034680 [Coptis chinensis]
MLILCNHQLSRSILPEQSSMAEHKTNLHIAMFPWLAFGHILPFLQLSKSLAQKGHHISFISTQRNLQRLPKIPPNLSPSLKLIPFPLPHIPNLPQNAECTADVTPEQGQFLWEALDSLEEPLTKFLEDYRPDWIIYDFATHWLPPIAVKFDIPCVYFNIFNASMIAYYGSASEMLREDGGSRLIPEDFIVPPKWIPFSSNLALHFHEAPKRGALLKRNKSKSPVYRLGTAIQGCEFMAVRSCIEFEGEWLRLLENELCLKPAIPVGLLPPPILQDSGVEVDERWLSIKKWLDKQRERSVVYVAFGSESSLTQHQVTELALGLEISELPFFWVLRTPHVTNFLENELSMLLPTGFEDRVKDRGFITMDWVPQLSILAHRSVGSFLTHGGWSSIIEGLGYGLRLILLPLSPPQALNARVLVSKNIGLEIPRNERDGSFTRDSVAESVKVVMVHKEGELLGTKAMEMKKIFGDEERQERYMDNFDRFLREYKRCS